MRKLIYILVATQLMLSCKTLETTHTVTIKDSTAIHTDTNWVTYHQPADSIKLADNLVAYMDSLGKCRVRNTEGTVESNKIKIKYIIRNDSIFIDCNTKSYEITIAQLKITIEHWRERYESLVSKTTVSKKRNWLSFWQSWACMGFILIVVVRFLLRLFKINLVATPYPPYISFKFPGKP